MIIHKILLTLVTLFSLTAFSATKVSNVTTGDFATAGSWSPSGVPVAGDSIVIRSGHTITVTTTNNLTGAPSKINIIGILKFNNGTNPQVNFAAGTVLTLGSAGQVQPGNSGKDRIFIGSAMVYSDNMSTVVGPMVTDGTNALPVRWGKVNAQVLENTKVILQWEVLSETNNSHFVVERWSAAHSDYLAVTELKSLGNSSVKRAYSFMDQQADFGTGYYRIKQVDIDGSFTYSQIIQVYVAYPIPEVLLFPNPVIEELQIKSGTGIPLTVKLFDANGNLVATQTIATEGVMLLSHIPSGEYYYQLSNPERIFNTGVIIK